MIRFSLYNYMFEKCAEDDFFYDEERQQEVNAFFVIEIINKHIVKAFLSVDEIPLSTLQRRRRLHTDDSQQLPRNTTRRTTQFDPL